MTMEKSQRYHLIQEISYLIDTMRTQYHLIFLPKMQNLNQIIKKH